MSAGSNATLLAVVAVTAILSVVPSDRPLALAARESVSAKSSDRPEKVATPATAETVVVP